MAFIGGGIAVKLSEISKRLKLQVKGNPNHEVTRISPPEGADATSLCVIWDKDVMMKLPPEVAIIAPEEYFSPSRDGLIADKPRAMLPELLSLFSPTQAIQTGIHPKAEVSPTAKISPNAYISALSYIGDNSVIGSWTIIEPNAVIMSNVKVGERCIIHSGAVIGTDGFGIERTPQGLVKIPQTGGVTIGDEVEIGACTTIDRGTMKDTVIGSGTKIDNHVQVGHNVSIGRNCIICSMSGIAGSTIIEDNVTISVQAGVTDHVRIGANTIIAGRTGVTNDIPSGSVVSGFPARPHNEAKRALVLSADLPSLYKRMRMLEKKLEAMQK